MKRVLAALLSLMLVCSLSVGAAAQSVDSCAEKFPEILRDDKQCPLSA